MPGSECVTGDGHDLESASGLAVMQVTYAVTAGVATS